MANPFDIFELLEQGCSPVERSIRRPGRCPGGDSTDTYLILDHATPAEGVYKLTKDVLVTL
jgi:hypothetical protein